MSLTEEEIFHPIVKSRLDAAGYKQRMTAYFNKVKCLDEEMLLRFIKDSQMDNYQKLTERCENPDEKIIEKVVENIDITNVLSVLKNEFEVDNIPFRTFYPKPEKRDWETDADRLYKKNQFSYIHEFIYYGKEEIDFGIFINGIPVASLELKLTTASSHFTYLDAIEQYQKRVNSSKVNNKINRYLCNKTGALFHMALDEKEAHVCTELKENNVYFLPFNKGIGYGKNKGAGNSEQVGDALPTSYIWDEILIPDKLAEIVYEFLFYEPQYDDNGRKTHEILIFPRYHQLTAVEKIVEDIKVNRTAKNYLIQHSAGSGKSNTIVWLAHKLSSLHDNSGKNIFSSVIILNDRKVVIKQLQENMKNLDTLVLNELICINSNKSSKLAQAIDDNKHIIISTLQAFLNVERKLNEDSAGKNFAILIDESHSSTNGLDIEAVCAALSKDSTTSGCVNTTYKPKNVSFIGFTATPKETTLTKFGVHKGKTVSGKDKYEPFDNYSMKQAIEEGFILDVLSSYVEVKAHCDVLKISEDDPIVSKKVAKEVLEKFIQEQSVSITDKVDIIMEHFINNVFSTLDGNAKAMIVTDSIDEVLEFDKAIRSYIHNSTQDYVKDIKHLIAFSGEKDGKTENDYNQLEKHNGEVNLEKEFNTKKYQILVVADKYQTGYDQPKLVAMYINKKLQGVQAVQTISRLNRPYHHPNEKNTYILDFVNHYSDIKDAFSRFYQTTSLCTNISKDSIISMYGEILSLNIVADMEIKEFITLNKIISPTPTDAIRMLTLINSCVQKIEEKEENERKNILALLSKYNRMYILLRQIIEIPEIRYENLYRYLENVLNSFSYVKGGTKSLVDSLRKRVIVTTNDIVKEQVGTYEYFDNGEIVEDIKGRTYTGTTGIDEEDYLSVVIEEINLALGNSGTNDTANNIIKELQSDVSLKIYARRNLYTDYADKFKSTYMKIITDMLVKHEITTKSYQEFMKEDKINKLSKATYNLFKS